MPLRFESRVFTLAKDPEQPSAFQDACCVDCDESVAAIADGVSSALFSGPWAAILVEAAVADLPDPTDAEAFSAWLDHQRAHWSASIDTASLAWHQKAKLASGAFSTLLVVRVVAPEASHEGNFGGHRVLAYGIGDSCLLHIRGGELVRTFPLAKADDFLADPIVLGSIDLKRDHLLQFAFLDEMCYDGDQLILCTDALAEWAVRTYESGEGVNWDDFWPMSDEDWSSGIAWLRQERQIRIDDTTMVMLRVVSQTADEHAEPLAPRDGQATSPAHGDPDGGFDWIDTAAKELKSVSGRMAEQVDQTSEKIKQGFRSIRDIALDKYRKTFGRKDDE
jgi:hypothetical protein